MQSSSPLKFNLLFWSSNVFHFADPKKATRKSISPPDQLLVLPPLRGLKLKLPMLCPRPRPSRIAIKKKNLLGLMIWFQWFLLSLLCHMQWYFEMFFSDVLSDNFISATSSSLHVRTLINSNTFMLIWYDHPLHGNVGTNKPMSKIVTSPSPLKTWWPRVMTWSSYTSTPNEIKGCMIHCTGFIHSNIT